MSADQQRAKRYEAIHNLLFVAEAVFGFALLLAFLFTGLSVGLANWCRSISGNPWLYVAIYTGVIVCAMKILYLPVDYYGGYRLEHQFGLSNESFGGWLLDEVKSFGLNLVLGILMLDVLYFLLRHAGVWWWLWAGGAFLLFGVVLTALGPVVILPLFYKLEPLDNESLKQKLVTLSDRVGARVVGVYRMALSDKTKKANAAFAGLGRTKRIILGDTLLEKFAEDEIEVVMAHEMAHYRHADIWRMIAWGSLTTLGGLWIADCGLRMGLERFGFKKDMADVGAFPIVAFCLAAFGLLVMPVNNAFSRWRERVADKTALELTGNRDAFVSAMQKLGEQNLADFSPHPAVEFFLHDHPSLARRIEWAKRWQAG